MKNFKNINLNQRKIYKKINLFLKYKNIKLKYDKLPLPVAF